MRKQAEIDKAARLAEQGEIEEDAATIFDNFKDPEILFDQQ